MLVFTREVGEQIQVGDQITVTVVLIRGNTVRLGIEAPPNTSVVRQELMEDPADQSSSEVKSESPTAR
jgi:carbon storage regulator